MDADIPAVSSSVSSLEVAKQIIHQSEGIRSRLQLMVMKAKEKLIKDKKVGQLSSPESIRRKTSIEGDEFVGEEEDNETGSPIRIKPLRDLVRKPELLREPEGRNDTVSDPSTDEDEGIGIEEEPSKSVRQKRGDKAANKVRVTSGRVRVVATSLLSPRFSDDETACTSDRSDVITPVSPSSSVEEGTFVEVSTSRNVCEALSDKGHCFKNGQPEVSEDAAILHEDDNAGCPKKAGEGKSMYKPSILSSIESQEVEAARKKVDKHRNKRQSNGSVSGSENSVKFEKRQNKSCFAIDVETKAERSKKQINRHKRRTDSDDCEDDTSAEKRNVKKYKSTDGGTSPTPRRMEHVGRSSHMNETTRKRTHSQSSSVAESHKSTEAYKDFEDKPFDFSKEPELNPSNPQFNENVKKAALQMGHEMRKEEPDVNMLKRLMKSTFRYRKFCYVKGEDLSTVLRNFPALRDFRFLKGDLHLLRKVSWSTLDTELVNPLMQEYQRFTMKNYLSPDPVIAEAKEQLKSQPDNKELLRDVQLLCLGFQKTKGKLHNKLYGQREANGKPFKSSANTPSIDIVGSVGSKTCRFSVYCEHQLITRPPNFYEAVMSAYSLYWLFNLEYESCSKKFFQTFDALIGED